ncbi:GNAT family N-acetyltransferase [Nocardioides sp. B-3]|uniref:GNAT family N-acetyltransferase n=1 Tax=Nocardioides sp. B-3 TaxID=2895565 RepID=UPI002152F8D8|nr:GNAT family N-acetyltransferase [Nocardioides sp. B-3]UUZ61643.1 GNAT family N-acetyltransferase [Nocardioides sp. B-3]
MFDGVGDDALTALQQVRDRYLEVNGEHPMSKADDAYVREHFTPATPEQLTEMAAGRLPLPGYLLTDGTPMVADISESLEAAGGAEHLHDWFIGFWPGDPATAEREWSDFLSGRYVCLRELNPISILRKTTMVEQARVAVDALRADRRDEIARGSLAEAVDGGIAVMGLDQILLPMTGYDRLRFGGPTVRDLWVDEVRAEFHNPQPPALPIHTERLTLRRTTLEDAAVRAGAWADPGFVEFLLHPMRTAADVEFETFQRSRPVPDGEPHTGLGLVIEHDGVAVGNVVLFFNGADRTCPEIGWTLFPRAAGQGFATEAARVAMALAFEHYGVRRVVANLDALERGAPRRCASDSACGARCTGWPTSGRRDAGPTPTSTPSSVPSGKPSSTDVHVYEFLPRTRLSRGHNSYTGTPMPGRIPRPGEDGAHDRGHPSTLPG